VIGDGINDAPALIAADVSLAIGGGADIAVEAADITLLGGDIARVATTVGLSRRTMRVIRQNLFWALGYNVAAILIAAALGTVLVQTGSFGKLQGLLQIVAGLVVTLLGLDLLGVSPWRNSLGFAPLAWLRRQFVAATARGVLPGAIIGGAINGLMPCSMTMAMAVKATTAPSVLEGGLLMLAFGAGTLPSMLSASFLFGKLGVRTRGWLLKGAALFVIVLGLATVWQGIAYYLVMQRLLG